MRDMNRTPCRLIEKAGSTWLECREPIGILREPSRLTGYLEVFWSDAGQRFVSVPGASRWMDLNGAIRAIQE